MQVKALVKVQFVAPTMGFDKLHRVFPSFSVYHIEKRAVMEDHHGPDSKVITSNQICPLA